MLKFIYIQSILQFSSSIYALCSSILFLNEAISLSISFNVWKYYVQVQEKARGKKLPVARTEVAVRGEVSSMAQAKTVPERIITATNALFLGSPNKTISSATAFNHRPTAPVRMSSLILKSSNMDLPKQEKLERMAYPTLKEQPKQEECELESKVSKLSLRPSKESHKAHKRTIGRSDGLTCQTEKDHRPNM